MANSIIKTGLNNGSGSGIVNPYGQLLAPAGKIVEGSLVRADNPIIYFLRNYLMQDMDRGIRIIKPDGTLWVGGYNASGTLGLGNTTQQDSMIISTSAPTNIIQGEGISDHILVVTDNGELWGVGANTTGKLGIGTNSNTSSFARAIKNVGSVLIDDAVEVQSTSLGSYYLDNLGGVHVAGQVVYVRALTGGLTANQNKFVQLTGGLSSGIVAIECQNVRGLFVIKDDGNLYAKGDGGTSGRFGVVVYDSDANVPMVPNMMDVIKIDGNGNGNNAHALKSDGTLWFTGSNQYGEAGVGTSGETYTEFTQVLDGVKDIVSMGETSFNCALRDNGEVWYCGRTTVPVLSWTKMDGMEGIIAITPTNFGLIGVSGSGTAYYWGYAEYLYATALGLAGNSSHTTAIEIPNISALMSVGIL